MKALVITGQTASGKTALAIKKAAELDGELVNCDSRQIYKKLDIVTGKDLTEHEFHREKSSDGLDTGYYWFTAPDGTKVRIWLYDIVDPHQAFSSHQYAQLALPVIRNILDRGKTPVIIGGTAFYLLHLLYGAAMEVIPPDWKLRKSLENKTVAELQDTLRKIGPQIFAGLNDSDRHNPQRLMRKIEIAASGKSVNPLPKSFTLPGQLKLDRLEIECLGTAYKDRSRLEKAIRDRVGARIKAGAVEETAALLKQGYSLSDPGLKTIGYPELAACLSGKSSLEEESEKWIYREIGYAKRQITFIKKYIPIDKWYFIS